MYKLFVFVQAGCWTPIESYEFQNLEDAQEIALWKQSCGFWTWIRRVDE